MKQFPRLNLWLAAALGSGWVLSQTPGVIAGVDYWKEDVWNNSTSPFQVTSRRYESAPEPYHKKTVEVLAFEETERRPGSGLLATVPRRAKRYELGQEMQVAKKPAKPMAVVEPKREEPVREESKQVSEAEQKPAQSKVIAHPVETDTAAKQAALEAQQREEQARLAAEKKAQEEARQRELAAQQQAQEEARQRELAAQEAAEEKARMEAKEREAAEAAKAAEAEMQQAEAPVEEAVGDVADTRRAYEDELERRLSEIEGWVARSATTADKERLQRVKEKAQWARNKLEQLKAAQEEHWKNLKTRVDAVMQDLERVYDTAHAEAMSS